MMTRTTLLSLFALTLSAITLTGCGFTPVHQTAAGGGSVLQDVYVDLQKGDNIADNQAGFFLTQRLRDRMGENASTARYTLQIEPDYGRRRLGLTNEDVASRFDITVKAKYRLLDTKTGDRLASGDVSAVSTFGTQQGPYGLITADNVGVEQASSETADKLIRELAIYFSKNKP